MSETIFNYVEGEEVLTPIDTTSPRKTLSEDSRQMRQLQNLTGFVEKKFHEAQIARQPTERRWVESWTQFNGELSSEEANTLAIIKKRNPTASSLFINITKTKTLAAFGQICEILFGDSNFPLEIQHTPEPEGIAEEAFIAPEEFPDTGVDVYGFKGDGKEIAPGTTSTSLLGGLQKKYQQFLDLGKKVVPGMSPDPATFDQISPAKESAARMTKVVQDQLAEQDIEKAVRNAVLECTILGTGCLKRPYTHATTVHKWEQTDTGRIYMPTERLVPKASFASVWNIYPDPGCRRLEDAEYVIERHLMTAHKLAMLKREKHFINSAIDEVLASGSGTVREPQWWENTLQEHNYNSEIWGDYEILEYNGYIDKDFLASLDYVDQEELKDLTHILRVNIWVCGGKLIRILINPFTPQAEDYYLFPYEENPYQIWGKGLPENMKDSQAIMNGSFRMAVDNLKFAGSVMFEVNENYLAPGQDMTIHNGKIFRTQGGPPGQTIFPITTPNVAQSNIQMLDKARTLADESTGQPSYSYGQYTTGQTRTASGMSMLMQAASLSIKTVVKNLDQYLLEPMGRAYFYWNMQFNDEIEEIHGDLNVVAKGTASLMQKEVQSQRLLSFLQISAGNQMMAPFINIEYVLKELAKSMGLDPSKAVNDREKAQMYAEVMGQLNNAIDNGSGQEGQMPNDPRSQGGAEPRTGGINPSDPTGSGGGNIGIGNSPGLGQDGFAANTG
jgi:hypothetical protein